MLGAFSMREFIRWNRTRRGSKVVIMLYPKDEGFRDMNN